MLSLKLQQTSCSNKLLGDRQNPQPNVTEKRLAYSFHHKTCSVSELSSNRRVAKLFKKETLTNMESRNTEILQFIPSILHPTTHKKNARMKYYTVMTAIWLTPK